MRVHASPTLLEKQDHRQLRLRAALHPPSRAARHDQLRPRQPALLRGSYSQNPV